jgi:CBS domain containing-hemolysin-like protein
MDDDLGSSIATGSPAGLLTLLAAAAPPASFFEAAQQVLASLATSNGVTLLLTAFAVVTLSGACSMTEAAYLSLSKLRAQSLAETGTAVERLIARQRLDFTQPLAAIVILNNIANVTGTAITGAMATELFHSATTLGDGVATAVGVFAGLPTLAVILAGEIIPKTFGENHPLSVARIAAYPLAVVRKVLMPVIALVGITQRPFLRTGARHVTSEEELIRLTELGQEQGAIEHQEGEFIQRVFRLNDITAEDIMTPRVDMTLLDADQTLGQASDFIGKISRSRIPLYRENRDEIVAVLDRIDALLALAEDKEDMPLTDPSVSFKPHYVPESMPADKLLVKLQKSTEPIAIVVGEYGETVGLVTLEDVLEQLVGEILDESDLDEGNGVHTVAVGEVIALGRAEVNDVNEALATELPNHRTVAGLVLDELGRIPLRGESFIAHGAAFTINECTERAILKVAVRKLTPEEVTAEPTNDAPEPA